MQLLNMMAITVALHSFRHPTHGALRSQSQPKLVLIDRPRTDGCLGWTYLSEI